MVFSSNFSRQSLPNEAPGNRHSAPRRGIQKTQRIHKKVLITRTGFRVGARNDDYQEPHLNVNEK